MSAVTLPSDKPLSGLEVAAILAVVVIWGVNNAAAKVATDVMPPLLTGALRFALAAACLAPFVRPPFPNWKALLLLVTIGGPVHYGLIYLSFSLAEDVSAVSVAMQLWVPITALFGFLLLGERPKAAALGGMAVAFLGVAIMMMDPRAFADWRAILVGLASAAAWALVTVIARRTQSVPPLKMQGLLTLVALPTLALGSAVFERGQWDAIRAATPLVWSSVVWAGLVSSVLATSLVFWLVQRREAGRVTPYLLTTPLITIFLGWAFLDDVLTWRILIGAAVTMGGVAMVALSERRLRAGAAKT